jgi:hypothetical protein
VKWYGLDISPRLFRRTALPHVHLPSVGKAKDFVQSLLPRAQKGEIAITISRGIKSTGIDDHKLANYDPKLARGASLGLETQGGQAIIEALKQTPPQ